MNSNNNRCYLNNRNVVLVRPLAAILVLSLGLSACGTGDDEALLESATANKFDMVGLEISIPGDEEFVDIDSQTQLLARALTDSGEEEITNATFWTSSNPGLASVSDKGLLVVGSAVGSLDVGLS